MSSADLAIEALREHGLERDRDLYGSPQLRHKESRIVAQVGKRSTLFYRQLEGAEFRYLAMVQNHFVPAMLAGAASILEASDSEHI